MKKRKMHVRTASDLGHDVSVLRPDIERRPGRVERYGRQVVLFPRFDKHQLFIGRLNGVAGNGANGDARVLTLIVPSRWPRLSPRRISSGSTDGEVDRAVAAVCRSERYATDRGGGCRLFGVSSA